MIAATTRVAVAPPEVPVEIGREEARELADRELSSPQYAGDSSSWIQQALTWIWERLTEVIEVASTGTTGRITIAVVVLALLAGLAAIVRRARPDTGRRGTHDASIFGDQDRRTAEDYRAAADAAAGDGDWSTAVVERFRAVAAELEERGVVEPHLGRTADELARDAATAMPVIHADLRRAAVVFDNTRYGGHSAGPEDHHLLAHLDRSLGRHRRSSRPMAVTANDGPA